MSRVDLRHIAWEMCENETQETNNEMFRVAGDIEVVPRKIVEMIIAECEKMINLSNVSFGNDGTFELTQDYYKGVGNCAKDIKSFALHFLDVFEKES